jgi:hypothetical protein
MDHPETHAERVTRIENEAEVADLLLPGVFPSIASTLTKLSLVYDDLEAAKRALAHEVAGSPIHRLERAAKLIAIPQPLIARMIEEEGEDYVKQLLDDVTRQVADIAKVMDIVPKETA